MDTHYSRVKLSSAKSIKLKNEAIMTTLIFDLKNSIILPELVDILNEILSRSSWHVSETVIIYWLVLVKDLSPHLSSNSCEERPHRLISRGVAVRAGHIPRVTTSEHIGTWHRLAHVHLHPWDLTAEVSKLLREKMRLVIKVELQYLS